MTQNSSAPDKAQVHYPSQYLLNAGFGLLAASLIAQAPKLFGAAGLLGVPVGASLWMGGSALALIVAGWLWRSRVRTERHG